jgi:hypothetical protein
LLTTGADAATNIARTLPANIRPLPVNVPKADLTTPSNALNGTTQNATTKPTSLSAPVVNNTTKPTTAATGGNSTTTATTNIVGDAPPLRRLTNVAQPVRSSAIGPQFETQEKRDEPQVSAPVPLKTTADTARPSASGEAKFLTRSGAGLMLLPRLQEMSVGEKRRISLLLKTDAPLGLAALTFKFDPRQMRIAEISMGNLLANAQGMKPVLTQSIDPSGLLIISIAPPAGAQPITGAGVLVFIDIEALAAGESLLGFDKENVHLIAADGRNVVLDLSEVRVVVK